MPVPLDRPRVLVVDDEQRSIETIARILDDEFEVVTASSADEGERLLAQDPCQVILCDQRMPGRSGVDFLAGVRQQHPQTLRIIISGYTDADKIIQAINESGIYHYITKPWHPDALILTVRNAARLYQLQQENRLLAQEMRFSSEQFDDYLQRQRSELKQQFHFDRILRGEHSSMNALCDQVAQLAPFDISVLVQGESGTGKELLARAIHYNSARAEQPFVVENCGAMHDELLSSELFGHRKGAFTGAVNDHVGLFEQANGGTIFLDEIGDISPAFQVKLLRVLQEREIRPLGAAQSRKVDVRVVAATNLDLQEEVRVGRFRADLYYRLASVSLQVPPLRDRDGDIVLIANNLLREASQRFNRPVRGFSAEVLHCFSRYHWPGNVRELQNEVQRMLVMSQQEVIGAELLAPHIVREAEQASEEQGESLPETESHGLRSQVEALEAKLIRQALRRHQGNKSQVADELGLSRVGLRNKMDRYGLGEG
ncbi:sigma-54-dependent transcriptional regulator [Aestuariirhabdus litorea]|uniref:Sigma-54-dependent Fis family transcriptional regulator n=1 Tax=Aestuariirhabdus litorea TaxID=2528527 RepID=A0A3P3VPS6_9GAMM|nr:sigma-54 dependent transcriptional regulator [Aestuariirhabdus litorea]RRJ83666.1 sigma-54-dependent Fis family transcriptional regulator [Aestuariirhabdus litorea]RWW96888.1 response regulator [Endozoicomonadaceae bacterium GTF-13]